MHKSQDSLSIKPEFAHIQWQEKTPYSEQFKDVYYSRNNGISESEYVFIRHNQLEKKFSALGSSKPFVIAETGFGTGLNFLCAWRSFNKHAPDDARLHFISFEKYPVSPEDFKIIVQQYKQDFPQLNQLIQQLPACATGIHNLFFDSGRIQLTLIFGDIRNTLPDFLSLKNKVNAWFFDGFAPAKNPDMWGLELFKLFAAYSAKHATFATFTASRMAKDSLKTAGFTFEKKAGFGQKRDMLAGYISQQPATPSFKSALAWLEQVPVSVPKYKKAVVIGGGMAGCTTARALAEKGWKITLLEQHGELCHEGSGNPQGMLYPKLSVGDTQLRQLIIQGYWHTLNILNSTNSNISQWHPCGLLQAGWNDKERLKQSKLMAAIQPDPHFFQLLSAEDLSHKTGVTVDNDGLWFEKAGWLHPAGWCQQLLSHPNIEVKTKHKVTALYQAKEHLQQHKNEWSLTINNSKTILSGFDAVIIACAHSTTNLKQTAFLPLKPIRGQISQLNASHQSQKLKAVLCGDGYTAPANAGLHTCGATFTFNDTYEKCRPKEHQANIEQIAHVSRTLFSDLQHNNSQHDIILGRMAYRCTTPDYMPVIGQVPDEQPFNKIFESLKHNARFSFDNTVMPVHKNLYVNTGHGSRGLITAPLSALILASMINDEPLPVSESLRQALHPARFLARNLIRSGTSKLSSQSN